MELFDYARYRARPLALLLTLGFIVVIVLGLAAPSGASRASAELLVRPGASQTSFSSDPDRFVTSELRYMTTEQTLSAAASASGIGEQELLAGLSVERDIGSEVVRISITADAPRQAVQSVNALAEAYVSDATVRSQAPLTAEREYVTEQVAEVRSSVTGLNRQISRRLDEFRTSNPDESVPPVEQLVPELSTELLLATSRLQQLNGQLASLESEAAAQSGGPSILTRSEAAESVQGWTLQTYAVGFAGVVLAVTAFAAIGLAASRRVLGRSRWNRATADSAMPSPVLVSRSAQAVDETRAQLRVRLAGRVQEGVSYVYFPRDTATGRTVASAIFADLFEEDGINADERRLDHALQDDLTTFLVVDTRRCDVQQLSTLTELPTRIQASLVPVLL